MTEAAPTGGAAPVQDGAQVTPEDQPQSFSQKDVDKIAGNRAKEAEQRAISRVLEQSGAESLDDVLSVYEAHKLTQAEMETAADKAEKAQAKAEEQAKESDGLYISTLREFALRDALRDSGIDSQYLPLALKVADVDSLEVDRKTRTVSGVEGVVEAIQEASPVWFGSFAQERQRVNAPQTTGTGVSRPNGQTPEERHAQSLLNHLIGG